MTPDGALPVFGVETEEQAKSLLILACQMGPDGKYYARELLQEQTLENLVAFSDRLQKSWDFWQERKGGHRLR